MGLGLWLTLMVLCVLIPVETKKKYRFEKPDTLYIAGFFPVSREIPEGSIGRGVMPAVDLAIKHINNNHKILKKHKLVIFWNDTNCDAAVGMKTFFDMMFQSPPNKMMLFGAACTHVTDPIAKAATFWNLTQLSYADTHPMFTQTNYPNFFRIVPSENEFNPARISLLQHFNWTRVGTLYQNEPRYSLAHNKLIADLEKGGFQVAASQGFADDLQDELENLLENDVRIILGNFNESWAIKVFCEAYRKKMLGAKYQWIIMGMYTEVWWEGIQDGMTPCSREEVITALQGVILTDLMPLKFESEDTISGESVLSYEKAYNFNRNGEYSRFHGYAYDGIWAIALAIQSVMKKLRHLSTKQHRNQTISNFRYRDNFWGDLFQKSMKEIMFTGVTGPITFIANQRKGYILLKQFQGRKEVNIGEYDGRTGTLDLRYGQELFWSGGDPPMDRTFTKILPNRINITIYAIVVFIASVGIVMAFIFLVINIRFRNQRYIKMSSPYLNNLIIVGCILTYTSVILLGLDSQLTTEASFPYICAARAWVLMAGFTLAFGSMFSKTWRVHAIFTNIKLNKKVIKDYQLFLVVVVILTIDIGIMTTWQIVDPFYRETKQMEHYPDPQNEDIWIIPENEYCNSQHMTVFVCSIFGYKGLLMVFGCFLAWETRHVSIPALNDSKYIGMSVYNVVIMCVIGAAISFVLSDQQDVSFIIIAVFIIFCTTATLCLVFVPKILELRKNQDGGGDKRVRATLKTSKNVRAESDEEEDLKENLLTAERDNTTFKKMIQTKEGQLKALLEELGGKGLEYLEERIQKKHTVTTLKVFDPLKKKVTYSESISDEKDVFTMTVDNLKDKKRMCLSVLPRAASPSENEPSSPLSVSMRQESVISVNNHSPPFPNTPLEISHPESSSVFENLEDPEVSNSISHPYFNYSSCVSLDPVSEGIVVEDSSLNLAKSYPALQLNESLSESLANESNPTLSDLKDLVKSNQELRGRCLSGLGDDRSSKLNSYLRVQSEKRLHSTHSLGHGHRRNRGRHIDIRDRIPKSTNFRTVFQSTMEEFNELSILPIFQKLLSERRNSSLTDSQFSVASCPNITIKCDIVEYL